MADPGKPVGQFQQTPALERRNGERYRVAVPVGVSRQEAIFESTTLDLSASGLSCLLPEAWPKYSPCKLKLMLSEKAGVSSTVELEGIVVQVRDSGLNQTDRWHTAIFFHRVSRPARTSLEKFLSGQATRQ